MSSERVSDNCGKEPNPSKPHLPDDPESCFRWVVCEVTERMERINYYLKLCQNSEYGSKHQKIAESVCETLVRDLKAFLKCKPLGFHRVWVELQLEPPLKDSASGSGGDVDASMDVLFAVMTERTAPTRYIRGVKVFVGGGKRDEDSSSSSGSSSSTVVDPYLPPVRE